MALDSKVFSFDSRIPEDAKKRAKLYLETRDIFDDSDKQIRVAIRVRDGIQAVLLVKDPQNGKRLSIKEQKEGEVLTLKWVDIKDEHWAFFDRIVKASGRQDRFSPIRFLR